MANVIHTESAIQYLSANSVLDDRTPDLSEIFYRIKSICHEVERCYILDTDSKSSASYLILRPNWLLKLTLEKNCEYKVFLDLITENLPDFTFGISNE